MVVIVSEDAFVVISQIAVVSLVVDPVTFILKGTTYTAAFYGWLL